MFVIYHWGKFPYSFRKWFCGIWLAINLILHQYSKAGASSCFLSFTSNKLLCVWAFLEILNNMEQHSLCSEALSLVACVFLYSGHCSHSLLQTFKLWHHQFLWAICVVLWDREVRKQYYYAEMLTDLKVALKVVFKAIWLIKTCFIWSLCIEYVYPVNSSWRG